MVLGAEDISQTWFVICGDYLPPIAIAIPLFLVALLVFIPPICAKATGQRTTTGLLEAYNTRLVKLVHDGARAVLRMKALKDSEDGSPRTEFFGYVVPDFFLFQAFSMVCFVVGFAAFTFLDVFLVEQSYECDANNPVLACFTTNAANMSVRVNCSTIDTTFNGSVPDLHCYEFVFRVSQALSAASGILVMGGLAFTVVPTFILFISKGEEGKNSKPRCCCIICTQVMVFAFVFVLLIVLPFIDIVNDRPGNKTFIELLMLFIIVGSTVVVPWPFFEKAEKHQRDVLCEVNLPCVLCAANSKDTNEAPQHE